jgi:NADH-quinone oxidoreductase subunit F
MGLLKKFESGAGTEAELDILSDLCSQILGRSFCALGDAASTPFPAALQHFREEFLAGTRAAVTDTFDPGLSTLYAGAR